MSKPGKASDSSKLDKLPFEDALQKLEDIVEAMETGDLPLEAMLAQYEQGMKLAKACQTKLSDAETRIHRLEEAADGALKLKAVPADSTDEQ
jgi:exodeoxyribonuclease VII small subunit